MSPPWVAVRLPVRVLDQTERAIGGSMHLTLDSLRKEKIVGCKSEAVGSS